MTTKSKKLEGMITGVSSGEFLAVSYAEMLPSWTNGKLLAKLAAVREQINNDYLGTFGEACDLQAFSIGLTTELLRRGVEYPA